jgi:hypothetical protein
MSYIGRRFVETEDSGMAAPDSSLKGLSKQLREQDARLEREHRGSLLFVLLIGVPGHSIYWFSLNPKG